MFCINHCQIAYLYFFLCQLILVHRRSSISWAKINSLMTFVNIFIWFGKWLFLAGFDFYYILYYFLKENYYYNSVSSISYSKVEYFLVFKIFSHLKCFPFFPSRLPWPSFQPICNLALPKKAFYWFVWTELCFSLINLLIAPHLHRFINPKSYIASFF